ncbi:MAG: DivIVA domain-containing protein [Candidatus Cloacimonetes bacterium]|nr:DivIVA domain-containing protein [Candidatus Cloacimonadota bacterium]
MYEKIEISPADIRHKDFKTSVVGGYDKKEVQEYLEMLAEQFEDLNAQRFMNNVETARVTIYEDKSQAQVAMEQIQKREELITNTLLQAQNTRDEIIRNAQKEAANIVRDAELSAKKAYDETNAYLNSLRFEFINLKESHRQYILQSHAQLRIVLERLEQDPVFKRENEEKINEAFEEAKKIKQVKKDELPNND